MSLFKNMPLAKRSYSGFYEKGQWKKGELADTNFMGTVQPASGRVMELLPEGKRGSETITVYAPINLEFTIGDIIVWEGSQYEVLVASPYKAGLLPHWELAASKKEGK